METKEDKLVEMADEKAVEFLQIIPGIDGFNGGQEALMKQAIFGFRIKQEATKNTRATTDQILRAARFLKPEEREQYVRATAPKALPNLKRRP